jgi:hypothetical protein
MPHHVTLSTGAKHVLSDEDAVRMEQALYGRGPGVIQVDLDGAPTKIAVDHVVALSRIATDGEAAS